MLGEVSLLVDSGIGSSGWYERIDHPSGDQRRARVGRRSGVVLTGDVEGGTRGGEEEEDGG